MAASPALAMPSAGEAGAEDRPRRSRVRNPRMARPRGRRQADEGARPKYYENAKYSYKNNGVKKNDAEVM